jgi:hypothetical protein
MPLKVKIEKIRRNKFFEVTKLNGNAEFFHALTK